MKGDKTKRAKAIEFLRRKAGLCETGYDAAGADKALDDAFAGTGVDWRKELLEARQPKRKVVIVHNDEPCLGKRFTTHMTFLDDSRKVVVFGRAVRSPFDSENRGKANLIAGRRMEKMFEILADNCTPRSMRQPPVSIYRDTASGWLAVYGAVPIGHEAMHMLSDKERGVLDKVLAK
jgi:hypothetical protein